MREQGNLKICFILGSYPKDWIGGAELQSYIMAKELSERRYRVYYLAINTIVHKPFYEVDEGIEVYRIKKNWNIFKYYSTIIGLFRKIDPDICYNRSRGELPLAYLLCKITRTPLIYALASDDHCRPKPFPYRIWRPRAFSHQWNYWLSQVLMRKVDLVLSQSNYQSRLLRTNFGISSQVIRKWIPGPKETELGPKDEPPIVLWLANIKDIKRPELFIALARECLDLKAKFIMAGHISDDNRYRGLFQQARFPSNFQYLGGVSYEEANDLMNKASIFISTSRYEGFPSNTFIQAWLNKVPTISLIDDPEGVLNREHIGSCSGSLEQMVKDVRFLLENKELRETMGLNARKYALRVHSSKKNMLKCEHVFQGILNRRKRAGRKKIYWISVKLLDKSTDHVTETEIIKKILQNGYQIKLFCGYRKKKLYYGLAKDTIHYVLMPSIPKIRSLFYFFGLFHLMMKSLFFVKPDVIMIDYSVNLISFPILLLGRLVQIRPKVIMDIRTIPVNVESFPWAIRSFFFSLHMARLSCDGLTFISPFMREYCSRRVNFKNKKISIWTSGFNEELFDPHKYKKTRTDNNFEIFYHGGITLSRGIGSLIRAVRILKDKKYPVSLKLIGNIVNETEIRNLIQESRLEDICTIDRPVPYEQVPQIIKNCDLPVIPFPDFIGWRVSSPIKLLEYLAMGKALVLTNIEAHRNVVDKHEFAFYAETADPEDLAVAIERAYKMRDRLEELGLKARDLALGKYTWGRQARELASFLDSLSVR